MEKLSLVEKQIFIIAAVLIAIAALSNSPADSEWNQKQISKIIPKEDFCFSVVSDIHNNKPAFDYFLKKVDKTNSFILVNGDFIHRGTNEEYWSAVASFKESKLPILIGIGNHELWMDSSVMFRKIFGPTYFSFNISDNLFIVLDNSRYAIDMEQYTWLIQELDKNYSQKFVIMHIPLFVKNMSSITEDAEILEELFIEKKPDLIIASHEHRYEQFSRKNIEYVITDSCAGVEEKNNSYIEICIHNKTFSLEKIELPSQNRIEKQFNTEFLPVFSISYRIILMALFCYIAFIFIRRNMGEKYW